MKSFAIKKSKPKIKPTGESMDDLHDGGRAAVSDIIRAKREAEKAIGDELDAGFFFSVVFATRKERDAFCTKNGIKLRDGEYIFGTELKL